LHIFITLDNNLNKKLKAKKKFFLFEQQGTKRKKHKLQNGS